MSRPFNPDIQFTNNINGQPLALGTVYFGEPNSPDPKANPKSPQNLDGEPVSATQRLNTAGKLVNDIQLVGNFSWIVEDVSGSQVDNQPLIYGVPDINSAQSAVMFTTIDALVENSQQFSIGAVISTISFSVNIPEVPSGGDSFYCEAVNQTPTATPVSTLPSSGVVVDQAGNQWRKLGGVAANYEQFGARGNNSFDCADAISNAHAWCGSTGTEILVAGNRVYLVGSRIAFASNLKVSGDQSSTIRTASDSILVNHTTDLINFTWDGVNFQTDRDGAVASAGLVNINGGNLSSVKIKNSTFGVNTAGVNGVLVVAAAGRTIDQLEISGCLVDGGERMGFEFINHSNGSSRAYTGLRFYNNTVKNLGNGSFNIGVSFSGPMQASCVGNYFEDCRTYGIEAVSVDAIDIQGNFFLGTFTHLISCSGSPTPFGVTDKVSITENKTIAPCVGRVFIDNSPRLIMGDNHLELSEYVELSGSDSQRAQIHNNVIITTGIYAMIVDGCPQARIYENELDNSASASSFATLRFNGPNAINGKAYLNTIRSPSTGARIDQVSGANYETGLNFFGDQAENQLPVGRAFRSTLVKTVDASSEAIVTINFNPGASWQASTVKLRVSSVSPGSSNSGFAEITYHIRHVNSANAIQMSRQDHTAPSGIAITQSFGVGVMTITMTAPSSDVQVVAGVEVDSSRGAVLIA